MSPFAIDLLLGALLALLVLSVGFLFGVRIGRWIAPAGTDESNPLHAAIASDGAAVDFQQLLSHWHDVRPRLAELASRLREVQQPPHDALAQWRSDLVRVTAELRQALKTRLRVSDSNGRVRRTCCTGERAIAEGLSLAKELLTNEQIVSILDQRELSPKADGEARPTVRHKFPARQLIVALPDDGGPPSAIREVQCDDLSVREFRYFVEESPSTKRVIVGLGVPSPVKWLMAEIVDSRSADFEGQTACLVTARFLKSIDHGRRIVETTDRGARGMQSTHAGVNYDALCCS